MKILTLLLLATQFVFASANGQSELTEADKAAILAVIDQDTRCYYNNDYDCWLECWSQHPQTSAFVASSGSVFERVSWKAWSEGVQGDMRDRKAPESISTRRENIGFIILGDQEVLCHFDAYSIKEKECTYSKEIRALRKESGRWKLTLMTCMFDNARKCED
jgi:hypothetical protein